MHVPLHNSATPAAVSLVLAVTQSSVDKEIQMLANAAGITPDQQTKLLDIILCMASSMHGSARQI